MSPSLTGETPLDACVSATALPHIPPPVSLGTEVGPGPEGRWNHALILARETQ